MDHEANGLPAPGGAASSSLLERENRKLRARIAELERLAACDALTALFNRRHFMEELDRWCWRAHRYGGEYGLLCIDIDNLKAIGERHGSSSSDALLVAIAKSLTGAVRRSDLVARIGEGEFAILLDNMSEAELSQKAERISRQVGRLEIRHRETGIKPQISAGFAPLQSSLKSSELLLRAKRSMAAAKQAKGLGPLT